MAKFPIDQQSTTLRPGRVEIWLVPLSRVTAQHVQVCLNMLDADEQTKYHRKLIEDAKLQFVVAHALLRAVLSRHAPRKPQQWSFCATQKGQPFLAEDCAQPSFVFSISHTKGLVSCALSRDCEIGIDVECCKRATDVTALAENFFAPCEARAVADACEEERSNLFFRFWTLKEAYIKARGLGLTLPLDAFWFDFRADSPRIDCDTRCADRPQRWRFWSMRAGMDHQLALAVASAVSQLRVGVHWVEPLPHGTIRVRRGPVLPDPWSTTLQH